MCQFSLKLDFHFSRNNNERNNKNNEHARSQYFRANCIPYHHGRREWGGARGTCPSGNSQAEIFRGFLVDTLLQLLLAYYVFSFCLAPIGALLYPWIPLRVFRPPNPQPVLSPSETNSWLRPCISSKFVDDTEMSKCPFGRRLYVYCTLYIAILSARLSM